MGNNKSGERYKIIMTISCSLNVKIIQSKVFNEMNPPKIINQCVQNPEENTNLQTLTGFSQFWIF
jgi:hypothetical protein